MLQLRKRIVASLAVLSLVVMAFEAILVFGSWIITAIWPNYAVRSLLGNEGLRWLLGSFGDNVSTPFVVWILLSGGMCGMLHTSGLWQTVSRYKRTNDYERMALWIVGWEFVAMLVFVAFVAFVPHALLLSAVGTLFPGLFSHSIVLIIICVGCIAAATYGCMVGKFRSAVDLFMAFNGGLAQTAPLVILYFATAEFYSSVVWVVNG